jgi:hypothetical protein
MIRRTLAASCLLVSLALANPPTTVGGDYYAMTQVWAHNFAMDRPWHGGYYHQMYGQPLALVVPPTAHMRQTLSWGVSQNLMYPLHHQFGRSANSPGAGPGGAFRPTPPWPSHTDQFGVYYVRGPWR